MSRAADLTRQALNAGLKPKAPLLLSPGSEQTRLTLDEAGVFETFGEAGATVLANACGPCCGSWNRTDIEKGTPNSVVSSYNRNFVGRFDANPATLIFLTSPEIVMVKMGRNPGSSFHIQTFFQRMAFKMQITSTLHLENISNNTLIGATNAFNKVTNSVKNSFTSQYSTVPETARAYKAKNQDWVIIADWNYGEGSSREHAALQPRYLNGKAIVAKSFARIHESNLKKQGILSLMFENDADYDRIEEDDRISLVGLKDLSPGMQIEMVVKKGDEDEWRVMLNHTFNEEQIEYFKAGSALNLMAQMKKARSGAEFQA
ncbi:aconitase [Acephala macrosclerotiorum]|nr:aconitase [Acephala macrosclerotiorum]